MMRDLISFSEHRALQYLEKFPSPDIDKEDTLQFLRNELFIAILLLALPFFALACAPSVIISLKTNHVIIAITDTISMVIVTILVFIRNIRLSSKKTIFSFVLFLLCAIIFSYLGISGPGFPIMFFTSILLTLYHSKKAGILAVIINSTFYFLMITVVRHLQPSLKIYENFNFLHFFGTGLDVFIFNLIAVLSVSYLIDQLYNSIVKEKDLQKLLKKESDDLYEAKLKAEQSDSLKTTFLSNLSHEIRTPMNGILGFASILGNTSLNIEDRQKYTDIIQKSSTRMINIINHIVTISKIESGLIDVSLEEVDINLLVESVTTQMKPFAEDKNLIFSCQNMLPPENKLIYTDREKLKAICTSLLDNALKFTDSGSIEFGVRVQPLSSGGRNVQDTPSPDLSGEILFFVKDTGIGIPNERLNVIFERFTQADVADEQAREGAGLGLSIAKHFAELLKGRIWVDSEWGKGSSFCFTIPSNNRQVKPLVPSEPSIPLKTAKPVSDLNILIAEDDKISAFLIEHMVKPISKKIILVTDGKEAVEAGRNNSDLDLILMYIKMPEMNGYEATRHIRTFNSDVIIIAQTAFVLSDEKKKALEAGCNDFISKPINQDELLSMIQKHFALKV